MSRLELSYLAGLNEKSVKNIVKSTKSSICLLNIYLPSLKIWVLNFCTELGM